MNRSPFLLIALPALLIALAVLGWQWSRSSKPLPMRDFVEYWSAGKAFLDGRNPYDPKLLFELQKQADPAIELPVMMWNPPWSFVIVAPLGLLSPVTGHVFWLISQLAAVLVSIAMLLSVYEVPKQSWLVGYIAGLAFTPLHLLLWYGQIGGFCLLGLAGFLYFTKRKQFITAGVFAAFTALKPHLLFAFGLMLLFDAVLSKSTRKVLIGGIGAILSAVFVAWFINPMVYAYYFESISNPSTELHYSVRDWAQPLLSYQLRTAIDPSRFSLQFLPTLIASVCLMLFWLRNRQPLNWFESLPWLVLVSVICTAYGAWVFDLVVLLVPVLCSTAMYFAKPRVGYLYLALAYLCLNGLSSFAPIIAVELFNQGVGLPSFIYFAPAVLTLFLISLKMQRR